MNNAIALTVPAIDQIGTLDFLGRMPPKTGDLRFDITQRQFWDDLRYRLHCYWSGQADSPKHWTKRYREEIDIQMMIYLNLYNVIFFAWTDIKEVASKHEIDIPKSALDYLKEVMLEDWLLDMKKSEMPLASTASHYRLGLKIKPANHKKLSKLDKGNLIAKIWERLPTNFEEIQFLKHFCLWIARNSSAKTIETSMKHYNESCQDQTSFLMKTSKPR